MPGHTYAYIKLLLLHERAANILSHAVWGVQLKTGTGVLGGGGRSAARATSPGRHGQAIMIMLHRSRNVI